MKKKSEVLSRFKTEFELVYLDIKLLYFRNEEKTILFYVNKCVLSSAHH